MKRQGRHLCGSPYFIINRKTATLLNREDLNTRDKSNETLSNREDVAPASVPSLIAKRAITETPSQAAITDNTTRKNVGKEQLPLVLSDVYEQKV